jgi:hypothetical protein
MIVIFCRRMAVQRSFFRAAIVFMSIARFPMWAQNGTAAAPQFEVASIRPSKPGSRGPTIYNPTHERFAISTITTKSLIAYAYDVRDFQVSGGPSWVGSEEYDIVAKPERGASNESILAMARALLAERFSLTLHHESKEMPALALVVSKGGPRLQPSVGTGGPEVRGGWGRLVARKVTMGLLAAQLAGRVLDRPVLDRTGIFTALQEQLGLKLETQKGTVDVLVVDHVERPSAN